MNLKNVIKTWLLSKKIQQTEMPLKQDIDSVDHRHLKKENFSQTQSNSLRAHDITCEIIGCNKNPCFIKEPDKIVSDVYVVARKTKKRM